MTLSVFYDASVKIYVLIKEQFTKKLTSMQIVCNFHTYIQQEYGHKCKPLI